MQAIQEKVKHRLEVIKAFVFPTLIPVLCCPRLTLPRGCAYRRWGAGASWWRAACSAWIGWTPPRASSAAAAAVAMVSTALGLHLLLQELWRRQQLVQRDPRVRAPASAVVCLSKYCVQISRCFMLNASCISRGFLLQSAGQEAVSGSGRCGVPRCWCG